MGPKHLNHFIGGHWAESSSGQRRACLNPADRRQEIGSAPVSAVGEVEQAIAAAQAGTRRFT